MRALRIFLWSVGGVLLAAIALFFSITVPVDRSAILGTEVASRTETNLQKEDLVMSFTPMESGSVHVGWACRSITPAPGSPTYGYGSRFGRGITAVADSVYVKALALSVGDNPPLVFLTADICLWVGDISERIREQVHDRVPRNKLYFGATHTHSGPGGYADGPLAEFLMGKRDMELCDFLVDQSVGSIAAAISDLQEGSCRVLATRAPSAIFNRTKSSDIVDDELVVVEYKKDTGEKCAIVFYGAHATTVASNPVICSADYPGAICRDMKSAGYDQVMFLATETSSAGPFCEGERAVGPGTAVAEKLGGELSGKILDLSRRDESPFTRTAELQVLRSELTLPGLRLRVLGRMVRPELASWLVGPENSTAFVQALRINNTVYVSHSFEFSSPIGRRLKDRLQCPGGSLIITGFNGNHNLYSVPQEYYDDASLEASLSLYGPGLGSYLDAITAQVYEFMTRDGGAK